jgi:hypothetical protein
MAEQFVVIAKQNGKYIVYPKSVTINVTKGDEVVWVSPEDDFEVRFPSVNACPFTGSTWNTGKRKFKKNHQNQSNKAKGTVQNGQKFPYEVTVAGVVADPEVVIKR